MSIEEPLSRPPDMSEGDFDLIERFVTAFNRIDRHLRELYHADDRVSFGRLVEIHLRKNPHWRDAEALRALKSVRNVIVHERELPYRYLFVPTHEAAVEIERIRDELIAPERLLPRFRRRVATVEARDKAAKLLKQIAELKAAKFPVYEEGCFRGLLTERGITHWLAHKTAANGSHVDLSEVEVGTILQEQEDGRNVEFLPAAATTDDLVRRFAQNPELQAVLITETGQPSEKLLGIATWPDAFRLLGRNAKNGS